MPVKPVVLHLIDNFEPGGAQNILAGIARHCAAGFRHEVAVLNGARASYQAALPEGCPVHLFRFGPARFLPEGRRLRRLIGTLDPHIVCFHLELSYLAFLLLKPWLRNKPAILAIHALPDQIPRFWFPLLARIQRWVAAYTVEDRIAFRALADRGVPVEKIRLIPIGTEIFEATGESPESAHARRWGGARTSPGGPCFLNIGRMVEGKGQALLLQAFQAYRAKGGRGRLCILGYGPLESRLKDMAHRLGLDDHVEFPGKTRELVPYYLAADVYVSAAVEEGMGVVIYDAMAFGLPIAAFAAGSIAEIVEDGANGRLAAIGDTGSLAAAMLELSAGGHAQEKISRTNARKIFDNYRNSRIAEKYSGLYRALAQSGVAPSGAPGNSGAGR
jgi:glycosyltransferase involved in cell wall biosynthesis